MVSKRLKLRNKWISGGLFALFSIVLLVNNVTDLFLKFGIKLSIQWVSWIGLLLVLLYTWWLASQDKL